MIEETTSRSLRSPQITGDIMFPGWAKVAKKRSWEHIENKGPWKGLSENEAENILKTKQLPKTVGIHKNLITY